jgi:hypothetical protein
MGVGEEGPMVCKACNTRLGANDRYCPNCGRTLSPGTSLSGAQPMVDDRPTPSETAPLPPAPVAAAPADELDLTESVELEKTPPPAPPSRRAARPSPPLKARTTPPPPTAAPASIFSLRPEELRARITEKPEMVERGLAVYRDPSSGKPTGVGYATEVGDVDLLAVDESGALVVVMVAERSAGDPVPIVLERVGWIAKHVARPGQVVRAIALLEPPPPALGYTARAVAETVAFKTWRVAVAVEDVDL